LRRFGRLRAHTRRLKVALRPAIVGLVPSVRLVWLPGFGLVPAAVISLVWPAGFERLPRLFWLERLVSLERIAGLARAAQAEAPTAAIPAMLAMRATRALVR